MGIARTGTYERPRASFGSALRLLLLCGLTFLATVELAAASAAPPPVEADDAGVGGGSTFATLSDARTRSLKILQELFPSSLTPGSFEFFIHQYKASSGGPYLKRIGLDVFEVLDGDSARMLIYMGYTLCMMFAVFGVFHNARNGKAGIEQLATIVCKCLAGGVIVSKSAMAILYAILMTIQGTATSVISYESGKPTKSAFELMIDKLRNQVSNNGMNSVTIRSAKLEGINDAYMSSVGALTNAESVDDLQKIGARFNEFADWFNATKKAAIPMEKIDADTLKSPETMSEPLRTAIREALDRILAAPPHVTTDDSPFAIGNRLKLIDDAHVPGINQIASTPDKQSQLNARILVYRESIRNDTQLWVRDVLVKPAIAPNSTVEDATAAIGKLWDKVSAGVTAASNAASALNPFTAFKTWLMTYMRKGVAWAFGTVLELIFGLIVEINLMILVLMYPLWLWDKTAKAFTGAVNNVFVAVFYLPIFQFGVLLLDLVFAQLQTIF